MTYLAHISSNALFVFFTILLSINISFANAPFIEFYVLQNSTDNELVFNGVSTNDGFPYADNTFSAIHEVNQIGNETKLTFTPDTGALGVYKIHFDLTSANNPNFSSEIKIYVVESIVKANNDYVGAQSGQTQLYDVLANDYSSNSTKTLSNIALSTGVSSVDIINNMLQATTENDFSGVAHISYTVCDNIGTCDVAELNISVLDATAEFDTVKIYTNRRTAIQFPFNLENRIEENDPTATKGAYSIIDDNALLYQPNNSIGNEYLTFEYNVGGTTLYRTALITILNRESNKYAFDDNAVSHINESIEIDVRENDFGSFIIASGYTNNQNFNGFSVNYLGTGIYQIIPDLNFTGSASFQYKINMNGLYEYAWVNVQFSDLEPELTKYHLSTPLGVPLVIDYDIPFTDFEFTCNENTLNGGTLMFYPGYYELPGTEISGTDLLIYTPAEIGLDGMEANYCLLGNTSTCVAIEIEVDVIDVETPDDYCAGADCVWPGDANNDGQVNMDDILSLGLCMGEMGYERDLPANNWLPYYGDNWNIADVEGMPLKHMDCDGNGSINYDDAMVVESAYLKRHTLNPRLDPVNKQSVNFDQVDLTAYAGPNGEAWTYVSVKLALGSAGAPVYDVNGVAFKFVFDTSVINESLTVDFYGDSWFALNNTPLTSTINPNINTEAPQIDAAISRTNMEHVSGYGIIGELGFIIKEDLEGFKLEDNFFNYYFEASASLSYNTLNIEHEAPQSVQVKIPLNTEIETPTQANLSVYPNPVGDWLNVKLYSKEMIETINVYDMSGKLLNSYTLGNQNITQLDMSSYNAGLYFIKVKTNSTILTKKVEVFN